MTDRQKLEKIKECIECTETMIRIAEKLPAGPTTKIAWGSFLKLIISIIFDEED